MPEQGRARPACGRSKEWGGRHADAKPMAEQSFELSDLTKFQSLLRVTSMGASTGGLLQSGAPRRSPRLRGVG